MKKWEIKKSMKKRESGITDLIDLLLENRGITTENEREAFLHPRLEDVTIESVGIDPKQVKKAQSRIAQAIEKREQIIVFGDYDVDGITGTAILWETLHAMGANVLPYIPHRTEEGYGLSKIAISNLLEKYPEHCHPELVSGSKSEKMLKHPKGASYTVAAQVQHDKECLGIRLIITTDNGIVANEAVKFANSQGIDVIITDHHVALETLPEALAIVHTTKLCGAGVAYLLAKELVKTVIASGAKSPKGTSYSVAAQSDVEEIAASPTAPRNDGEDLHLELAALGTIADMVPLIGANRTIVKFGLQKLQKTKRIGLNALYQIAGIDPSTIGIYEVGFMISPRLNASGRLTSAMDSLRLVCTNDKNRAENLAMQLEATNKERQVLLKETAAHAIAEMRKLGEAKKLLIIDHEEYQEGIIGLVAGKLVQEFYRPAIVIAKGEKKSKASARSVTGFNIIEFLRSRPEFFVNVGGHPMAAGFTIETEKIALFKETLEALAHVQIEEEILVKRLAVDCELPLSMVDNELYQALMQLAPFGMKNPEPTFVSRGVTIEDIRLLGKDRNHVKMKLSSDSDSFDAIGFGMADLAVGLKTGDKIDIVYTIDENVWNGNTKLQLKLRDISLLE